MPVISVTGQPPLEQLRTIRQLWRGTHDSTGYASPVLVFAACKLLDPPPGSWKAKNLWLVFYDESEMETKDQIEFEIQGIVRRGFELYERFKKEEETEW